MLDQDAFQQLLAAAYTLQTQKDRLLITPQFLEFGRLGRLPGAISEQSFPKPAASEDRATQSSADGSQRMLSMRIFHNNELFWKTATVAAVVAVAALLLGGSVNSLAPLPAGITVPPELAQQEVPFHRGKDENDGVRGLHHPVKTSPSERAHQESIKPPNAY